MKTKQMILALLSAVLLCGALAGCGGSEADWTVGDYSVAGSLNFMDPDEEVLSVGGRPVTWREYGAYMLMAVTDVLDETGKGTIADWDADYSGATQQYSQEMTYGEYVKFFAWNTASLYRTIDIQFESQGLTLDADSVQSKEDFMSANGMTEESEFEDYLSQNGLTEELFYSIQAGNAKYGLLMELVYGENGRDCPDDEVRVYAESYSYMRVKQIYISGVTDESKEKAETFLAVLQETPAEELEAVFDAYVASDSEDENGKADPDGYLFTPGTMNDAFEKAAEALNENELSGVVESGSGYHIILRLPIDCDMVPYGASSSLRYQTAADRFDSIIAMWQAGEETIYQEAYDQIIVSEVFVKKYK